MPTAGLVLLFLGRTGAGSGDIEAELASAQRLHGAERLQWVVVADVAGHEFPG